MRRVALITMLTLLGGCAQDISPNSYSVGSVGMVNRSIAGTIISARPVDIRGTSALGGAAGTAAGAAAGSAIGGGTRANIVGAVVGGLTGAALEASATKQTGMEYVIETENGNLMTVVQGNTPLFVEGNKILVLYGSPSRIIADPRH